MLPEMCLDGLFPVLPSGKHGVRLDDLYDRFVTQAPYREERERIWIAFRAWHQQAAGYFPGASVFIDGGFVTWKPWEPPSDIDVTIFARKEQFVALESWRRPELFNDTIDGTTEVRKPQNGLVDAHWAIRGIPQKVDYWTYYFSRVRGKSGEILDGATKGFLEVTL